MKVMRDNPATFQAAVALATNEQNFRRRFSLRMGRITRGQAREEPMEVDHYRAGRRCLACNGQGHSARECGARRARINAVEPPRIQCYKCNGWGHMKKDCRQCYKCKKWGHFARDCPEN